MKNKLYKKDEQIISLSPLQVTEGMAEGLIELTQAEIDELNAPKPPTAEEVRAKRDYLIQQVRWRIERHNDEVELNRTPTEELRPLLDYVQALRDIPQQSGFPENVIFPEEI